MIVQADSRYIPLRDNSVQMCVTSPPYFGLRDYGTARWEGGDTECDHSPEKRGSRFATPVSSKQASNNGSGSASRKDCDCGARRIDVQIGLELSVSQYVAELVTVFREVKRILKPDGTLWLNIADSYNAAGRINHGTRVGYKQQTNLASANGADAVRANDDDLKEKDLMGIPWRLAFALQDDGWYLRSDIIWAKPNPMPESVTDRPTRSHEYLFLLSKASSYYYDTDAIREPANHAGKVVRTNGNDGMDAGYDGHRTRDGFRRGVTVAEARNKRDVWTIQADSLRWGFCTTCQHVTEKEKKCETCGGELIGHYAAYPEELPALCIKAGTSEKGECSRCGKSWIRNVERKRMLDGDTPVSGGWQQNPVGQIGANGIGHWRITTTVDTLGWEPQCKCDAPVQPSIVFDPFLGTGTTGVAATGLGRRWVGTELSSDYILLAKYRAMPITLETIFG